jgi:23S rRNA pseudouridine1911/1915/1917 synthase
MNLTPTLFLVSDSAEQQRLDHFLTAAFAGAHSRSQIASFIKNGAVSINGRVITKPSWPVTTGTSISVHVPNPPLLALTARSVDFEIIAEEEDFLVINKPAGLTVHHAASAPGEITLVHGLLARYPEFSDFDGSQRPGIVHRLDKNTSGLLLVARNPQALTALAELFKDRALEKKYHAFVAGWPPRKGTIDLPIGRDPIHRHKMSSPGVASRNAITHYQAIHYYQHAISLLELTIVTGRTHQIRVHCAHNHFPVLGDTTYGSASTLINRQALHAYSLGFTYKDTRYSYIAPYPTDMAYLATTLVLETE